jgi:Clp amino terminal domain, pathogenicity island component
MVYVTCNLYTHYASYVEVAAMFRRQSDKFAKFTERARTVLSLAQEEAQQLNHNYIGTEHILLGLIREGDGLAAKVLQNLGVDLASARREVLVIIGRGDRIVLGEVGMTPRVKKVMELAVDEARRLNHHYIGTEHLLLGLIREGEGIAAGVLGSLGVELRDVDREIGRILGQENGGRATQRDIPEQPAPKNNVVTCRLDDAALGALDALVEAGIRSTRSDAAAWLISAGIASHRALFDRVNTTVNEIRKLRLEAQDIARQVTQGVQGTSGATEKSPPTADETTNSDDGENASDAPDDPTEPPSV